MRLLVLCIFALAIGGCADGLIVGGAGGTGDGDAVGGSGDPGSPGSTDDGDGNGGGGATVLPDNRVERTFAPEDDDIVNPERGTFVGGNLVNGFDFDDVRDQDASVAYVVVRLDAWRTRSTLPADFLETLDDGFDDARAAGVKILLRFVYNFDASGADATKSVTVGHIRQLAPVLRDNADVIASVQAGLIGAWGEWHSSSNDLDDPDDPEDRKTIVEALLEALPSSRSVMLRSPMYKDENWGETETEEAFDGSSESRIGHHNDCFLASDDDSGTYASPVDAWKDYVADDGRFLPVAGEVCKVNRPRTDCDEALDEMADLRYSLLSRGGADDVWDRWEDDGCADNVFRHLGYRFAFVRTVANQSVAPGDVVTVDVDVQNTGFAAPYNPRPVYLVLTNGDRRYAAPVDSDPRRWSAGATSSLRTAAKLPDDLEPGEYRMWLWLPDDAERLRADPAFSIRFASEDVWDDDTGMNQIGSVVVDPAAPEATDPSAVDLVEL